MTRFLGISFVRAVHLDQQTKRPILVARNAVHQLALQPHLPQRSSSLDAGLKKDKTGGWRDLLHHARDHPQTRHQQDRDPL